MNYVSFFIGSFELNSIRMSFFYDCSAGVCVCVRRIIKLEDLSMISVCLCVCVIDKLHEDDSQIDSFFLLS